MQKATLYERLAAAWADGRPSAAPLWQVVQEDWTSRARSCEGSLCADFLWVPVHRDDGQQLLWPPADLDGLEPLVWGLFYREVVCEGMYEDEDGVAMFFKYDDAWAAALAPAGPPSGHQFLLEWDAPCEEAELFIQQLAHHRLMATLRTADVLQAWWFGVDEEQRRL